MKSKIAYINSKNAAITSIIVIVLTCVGVWLFGIGKGNTLFENSITSTSILSSVFFLFIAVSLYRGFQIKDGVGDLTKKINTDYLPDTSSLGNFDIPDISAGDGIGGIIVGILLWIVAAVILALFIWIFSFALWAIIIGFAAMLYWIFFRALRLAFRHSEECKGDFGKSSMYGLVYTLIYNFWIFGVIILIDQFS